MSDFRITAIKAVEAWSSTEYYGCINCNNGTDYWELTSECVASADDALLEVLNIFTGSECWRDHGHLVIPKPVKRFIGINMDCERGNDYMVCIKCTYGDETWELYGRDEDPKKAIDKTWAIYDGPVSEWSQM